jgi:hypothetical protein
MMTSSFDVFSEDLGALEALHMSTAAIAMS